jgi:hypothetical protein
VNKAILSTPYVSIEIKDDILYFTYLSGSVITINTAKEIVKQRLEYMEGRSYPILVTGEGIRAMDKESRDYFAKEGVGGLLAAALVVDSVYTEFFGNMFLRITQTSIPSKLFRNKEEALHWLEQYKTKV